MSLGHDGNLFLLAGSPGFAIGRTIWWDAVQNWKEGRLTRAEAAAAIGAAYRRFIDAYEGH